MGNKRLLYIDYAKGIGILFMLLQHSIPQHNNIRLLIQAFCMPLFFVVGGYLWNYKEIIGKTICLSKGHIINRIHQLGIPYLIACGVLALFYELLSIVAGGHSILHSTIRIVTLQGIDSMWFLPVYFFSEILFLAIIGLRHREFALFYFVATLLFLHLIVKYEGSPWPFALIEKSLLGSLYFIGGYVIAKYEIWQYKILLLLLFVLGLIGSFINGFASFAELHIPSLYLFNGIVLSFAVIALSKILVSNNVVSDFVLNFGRETLIVLCSNNLFIEIIRLIDYKLFNNILLNHGMLGNFMMFVLLVCVEVYFIHYYRRVVNSCSNYLS